jgi:hypothetical protein
MSARTRLDLLSSPFAAGAILLAFWIGMTASIRDKSLTIDEPAHAVAGYSYWRFNDYRLNPENGNLPQRWMALPFLFGHYAFPATDQEAWTRSDEGSLGDQWFNRLGNDTAAMVFRGRAMCGLLAAALGGLVWWWSRRLFGPIGGLLSLLLFVLDPTILANGPLMTSDTACALFFLAAVGGGWALLQRISPGRVALSTLAAGALFVSKTSAILLVPIMLTLGIVRLFSGPPVSLELGRRRSLASRRSRAAAFLVLALVHAAVIVAVIWASDGFRYQAFAAGSPPGSRFEYAWPDVLGSPSEPRPALAHVLAFLREHHLLPEAYIFGQAHAWRDSHLRSAFLNGRHGFAGWWWFFPYTFLVKTPLAIFGVIALAAVALRRRWPHGAIPLVVFFGFYWAAAISSHLNIGHRHILATYPPLFVLCGAAGAWLAPGAGRTRLRVPGLVLCGLMAALLAETACCFPNYLSYFNRIAGGPAQAYRHLVDSSLDWGQDLPALKRYTEEHPAAGPAFLSYFGIGSPVAYRIPAHYLYSVRGQDVPPPLQLLHLPADQAKSRLAELLQAHPEYQVVGGGRRADGSLDVTLLKAPAALRLQAGTYFISASMLQPVMYGAGGPIGPWNQRFENTYQLLSSVVKPLLGDNAAARDAALPRYTPYEWSITLAYFDMFRFARLTAYLREREPADTINGSILVYPLSEEDIARAVDGPTPPLGLDLPVLTGLFKAAPVR